MCGIIGEWNSKNSTFVKDNLDQLKNRGPDNQSIMTAEGLHNVTFGHTRLAIRDLSDNGNQPMIIGKFMMTYNGELWNYDEIVGLLKAANVELKTTCDTEAILQYYITFCREDPKKLIEDLNGMIAAGIYDEEKDQGILFRDLIGEKPLYFNDKGQFCSKQSVLSESKKFKIDTYSQLDTFGYPGGALYDGVHELMPGQIWINGRIMKVQNTTTLQGNYKNFKKKFEESVARKIGNMDVEFCLCLSGGLDSSLILSTIKKNHPDVKLNTITIGFDSEDDDFKNARILAEKFGTNHKEVLVSKEEAWNWLGNAVDVIDFPMELGSVVVTTIIADKIKDEFPNCKVVILGDGADELMFGYKRHLEAVEHLRNNEEFDYGARIAKNNIALPFKVKDLETIRDIDLKNELVMYHMKRVDMIFSEYGIEARCPFLYKPLIDVIMNSKAKDNISITYNNEQMQVITRQNKKWIRKFLEDQNMVDSAIFEQKKRPLKLFENMDKFRSELIQRFIERKIK